MNDLNKDELSCRRFDGNGNVLCGINTNYRCPFVRIVDRNTAFCLLFRCKIHYVETGNNDLCYRCDGCLEVEGT